jgi:hypothetical protein
MFIGHFGAGLAAKAIDPKPSLGTLFMASQFLDLLLPILLLTGIEKVEIDPGNTAVTPLNFVDYPISHGLLWVVFWAVLFGGTYYLIRKNIKTALIAAGLVLSHFVLDLVSHRPDLALTPWGDARFGFGLWNSKAATVLVEGAIFLLGVWFYTRATTASNKVGHYSLWALVAFLSLMYVANLTGPPPPSTQAFAYVGLSQWLLVGWAYWIDRNRTAQAPAAK